MIPDFNAALEKVSRMSMGDALMVCHMFMEKVDKDGGIEAVLKDLEREYPEIPFTKDSVRHAMSCGGAIILLTLGMGVKMQKQLEGDAPKSEAENLEAQREAQSIIERIRKLH